MRFEDAKAGIGKLAARVESEKTDAQDVTRRYLDMEARLRNLRAQEAQYLAIMKSAYPAQDLLDVSRKLSEVRGEIEQRQAEFQTLPKQTRNGRNPPGRVLAWSLTVRFTVVIGWRLVRLGWAPDSSPGQQRPG